MEVASGVDVAKSVTAEDDDAWLYGGQGTLHIQ